jgi:hypothetical protein
LEAYGWTPASRSRFLLSCVGTAGLRCLLANGGAREVLKSTRTHLPVSVALARLPCSGIAFVASTDSAGWEAATVEVLSPHSRLDLGKAGVLPPQIALEAESAAFRGILTARHRRYLVIDGGCGLPPLIAPVPSELPVLDCVLQTRVQRRARAALFGDNVINVVVPSRLTLVAQQIVHPFFLFQIFAVGLWLCEDYFMYASAIMATSLFSCFLSATEAQSNMKRLADLAQNSKNFQSARLVPGDVIAIEVGSIIAADCTIVQGSALMDESSLTGEAAPVRKTNWSPSSSHVRAWDAPEVSLFAGTRVVTTHVGSRAIVTRTACSTSRGELVRSILLKPGDVSSWGDGDGSDTSSNKGSRDIYTVLSALFGLGLIGSIFSAWRLHYTFQVPLRHAIIESLDLLTIAVPPALPATVTFGLACAMARLSLVRVLCVRASAVPRASLTDVVCFDKVRSVTHV